MDQVGQVKNSFMKLGEKEKFKYRELQYTVGEQKRNAFIKPGG